MRYKKLLAYIVTSIFMSSSVFASGIPYENIKEGGKIKFTDAWTSKVSSKDNDCYVRAGTAFISKNSDTILETDCNYIFIYKGRLLGYSDAKFYELGDINDGTAKRELLPEEIGQIFKDFKIIKITDFSPNTNSYRYKINHKNSNIMVINDTASELKNYTFYTTNAKISRYPISNAIKIKKRGMIQFISDYGYSEALPVYVILAG